MKSANAGTSTKSVSGSLSSHSKPLEINSVAFTFVGPDRGVGGDAGIDFRGVAPLLALLGQPFSVAA